jgi:hypothetical protein
VKGGRELGRQGGGKSYEALCRLYSVLFISFRQSVSAASPVPGLRAGLTLALRHWLMFMFLLFEIPFVFLFAWLEMAMIKVRRENGVEVYRSSDRRLRDQYISSFSTCLGWCQRSFL